MRIVAIFAPTFATSQLDILNSSSIKLSSWMYGQYLACHITKNWNRVLDGDFTDIKIEQIKPNYSL